MYQIAGITSVDAPEILQIRNPETWKGFKEQCKIDPTKIKIGEGKGVERRREWVVRSESSRDAVLNSRLDRYLSRKK